MSERARRRGGSKARRAQRSVSAIRRAQAPGAVSAITPSSASSRAKKTLVIACGALAGEIMLLKKQLKLDHLDLHCLPAGWHNTPRHIPAGVEARIEQARREGYGGIFVAYADCGTGGALDEVLRRHDVKRLPGAHCYAFLSGVENFMQRLEEDARAYFLTDYLARHFDTLVWKGMMLDKHPELLSDCFGNYEKLVHLAQADDPELETMARAAAQRLGLRFERRLVGHGDLKNALASLKEPEEHKEMHDKSV